MPILVVPPGSNDLIIDTDHTKGQTRHVDSTHVKYLASEFKKNKPDRLQATVWFEQGVYLAISSVTWFFR